MKSANYRPRGRGRPQGHQPGVRENALRLAETRFTPQVLAAAARLADDPVIASETASSVTMKGVVALRTRTCRHWNSCTRAREQAS